MDNVIFVSAIHMYTKDKVYSTIHYAQWFAIPYVL